MKRIAAALMITLAAILAGIASPPAGAAAADAAYAGMAINQGGLMCTLGYVDDATGLGYSAGHCRGSMTVTDENGQVVGTVIKGLSIDGDTANDWTMDYELIRLHRAVTVVDDPQTAAYGPLLAHTGIKPEAGMTVCHDGAKTGHSCGVILHVYDGSFSMGPGRDGDLISDHGDSGGPVYALIPGTGRVLVGIFEGRRGNLFMAVSWPEIVYMSS